MSHTPHVSLNVERTIDLALALVQCDRAEATVHELGEGTDEQHWTYVKLSLARYMERALGWTTQDIIGELGHHVKCAVMHQNFSNAARTQILLDILASRV